MKKRKKEKKFTISINKGVSATGSCDGVRRRSGWKSSPWRWKSRGPAKHSARKVEETVVPTVLFRSKIKIHFVISFERIYTLSPTTDPGDSSPDAPPRRKSGGGKGKKGFE